MATFYRRLLKLRIEHDYHEGSCTDLAASPTATCARALGWSRLRARPLADGIEIIAAVDADGAPLVSLPDGLSPRFDLRVVQPRFVEVSDLRAWSRCERPLIRLGRGGELDYVEDAIPQAPGTFARVELPELDVSWMAEDEPQRHTLRFDAASTRWVYYVVTGDWPNKKARPSIVDLDPARASAPLEFEASGEDESTDPIVAALGRLPESRWVRLVSKTPLSARVKPRRHLSLRLGKHELLAELPNPSPRRLAQLALHSNEPPQLVSYHVVRV